MTYYNLNKLNTQTTRRHYALRIGAGARAALRDQRKLLALAICLITILALWLAKGIMVETSYSEVLVPMMTDFSTLLILVCGILALAGLLILFGTPWGAPAMANDLQRAGLVNEAEEPPMLLARYRDSKNPKITILEFWSVGIPRTVWEEAQAAIEAALNVYIAKIEETASRRKILLHVVPADHAFPTIIPWKDEYLSPNNFVLVLGQGLASLVTVNLAHIPHILLGGSTGSGKSVLLKCLLMQCLCKGAVVAIADFKGGVDYPIVWHQKCAFFTDQDSLIDYLDELVAELEHRKSLLLTAGVANIDEYNALHPEAPLQRQIFACDEIAELLDKTGLDKEQKESIAHIESRLATIARQGRAFGIHLILATQRPDANILSGQIRNNLDCRICGRADNVLSQIILDSTDAADLIPKDARGRFLLHDGTVFQGFLMEEGDWNA